ncbi:fluoride efflux transporter FluC [Dialister succinatiphilus]|uniref:fluoride efflux transporter FluC n=1 Tax=Dialister succinatiphilus TaxID=487173 RepID=UPI003F8109A9
MPQAAFLITGFLGGLTTFSSFMNETLQLWASGRWLEGLGYMFTQLACGLLLVALGTFLAEKIFL